MRETLATSGVIASPRKHNASNCFGLRGSKNSYGIQPDQLQTLLFWTGEGVSQQSALAATRSKINSVDFSDCLICCCSDFWIFAFFDLCSLWVLYCCYFWISLD